MRRLSVAAVAALLSLMSLRPSGLAIQKIYHETLEEDDESQDADTNEKLCLAPGRLLFLHIMKSGGTSVDKFLSCVSKRVNAGFMLSLGPYEFHEGAESCQPASVCSTHGAYSKRVELCGPEFENPEKVFTVMRDPVDRAWSHYNYQKAQQYKDTGEILPPILDVISMCADVNAELTPGNRYVCQSLMNHMTLKTFSDSQDKSWSAGYSQEDMDEAKDMVRRLDAVFFMDDFDSFVQQFRSAEIFEPWASGETEKSDEDELGRKPCALDHSNSAKSVRPSGLQPCDICEDYPSEREKSELRNVNHMDVELYEWAKTHFDRTQPPTQPDPQESAQKTEFPERVVPTSDQMLPAEADSEELAPPSDDQQPRLMPEEFASPPESQKPMPAVPPEESLPTGTHFEEEVKQQQEVLHPSKEVMQTYGVEAGREMLPID